MTVKTSQGASFYNNVLCNASNRQYQWSRSRTPIVHFPELEMISINIIKYIEINNAASATHAHPPEIEKISRNVIKLRLLIVLDHILQAINRLHLCNPETKYTLWIITKDQTEQITRPCDA
jgi:hypothetical protein